MPYCNAGETARVTFPDGSKKDWAAPIDITCEDGALTEERIRVDIHVRQTRVSAYSYGTETRIFERYSYNFSGYSVYAPVVGSEIRIDGNLSRWGLWLFTTNSELQEPEPVWLSFGNWNNTFQTSTFEIVSIKKRFTPDQGTDYLKKLITVKRGAQQLHQAQYDSCAFNVECVIPCPENTLDCGGCCLDCASIFNQLSALEQKVLSIK